MSTTILVIFIVILLLMVMKLFGVVFFLSGWILKFLIVAGLIIFLLVKIPKKKN